jgi:acetyl-CoA C-acetyltransferase
VRRAQRAVKEGDFAREIAPVTVTTRKGEQLVAQDETPFSIDVAKVAQLKPAFGKDGTVTAASSSSISDGAAALIVTTAANARERGLKPMARIVAYGSHAQEPEWFTTAPGPSVRKVLDRAGWQTGGVDLYEINEAFACVTMVAIQELGLDHSRVNVNGGACALGHPIGATGARLITTLIHALRHRGLKRGIASQCIGGGEAASIAIEITG